MATPPKMGPVIIGTLLAKDLAACVEAYEKYLHVTVQRTAIVSKAQAGFWGLPQLEGCVYAVLVNSLGAAFLRIVEYTKCATIDRLKHTGWLALEIIVENVDAIAKGLDNSPFEVLRPVADLSLSNQIRAVQVRGPAGEILYLTQIKGDVPPFELPQAKCAVEGIFIPVLCTNDRSKTLKYYEDLVANKGLEFNTKITVINQAYGYELGRNHPVATLQLADKSLIEIDEIEQAQKQSEQLAQGILMVTFAIENLPAGNTTKTCPTKSKRSMIKRGINGEIIELVLNLV